MKKVIFIMFCFIIICSGRLLDLQYIRGKRLWPYYQTVVVVKKDDNMHYVYALTNLLYAPIGSYVTIEFISDDCYPHKLTYKEAK